MAREFEFEREIVNPGAITVIQVAAGTAMPLVVMKAKITQRSSVTSTQIGCYLVRKTAAATVTAAVAADIRKLDPGDSASVVQLGTALTGYVATAEGTDGDVLDREGVNILNGWYFEPQPELRPTVPGAGIIGLKFSAAPPAGTYSCYIAFAEGLSS
jgi:hypothetical protein